jgi:adenine/guanine phosphoribosyltransferase-like PRPP-binding protein
MPLPLFVLVVAILIVWITIALMLIQYGPQIIEAVKALADSIRNRNIEQGKAAVSKSMQLALEITEAFKTRSDLTNEQKREQAWRDLIAGMASQGVTLSESQARRLSELAYGAKKEELPPETARTPGSTTGGN